MTTVGFGEVYPRTDLGRMVGTATMLSGVLLIALPIAIIGQKFQEAYDDYEERQAGSSPMLGVASSSSISASRAAIDRPATSDFGKEELERVQTRASGNDPDKPSSFADVSRRLRLMQLPSPGFSALAQELADEMDQACTLQKEIISMQSFERARQCEVAEHFDNVLTHLCKMCNDTSDGRKSRSSLTSVTQKSSFTPKASPTEGKTESSSPASCLS